MLQHILGPLAVCCLVGKQGRRPSHAEERVGDLLVSISSAIPAAEISALP